MTSNVSELRHVPNSLITVAYILFGVLLSLLVLAAWYYTPFSRTMRRDLPPTFGTPRNRRMPSSVLYRWTFPSTRFASYSLHPSSNTDTPTLPLTHDDVHAAGGIQARVNCHCEEHTYVTTAESSKPRYG